MRLELYQAEAARIATEQTALLDEARQILASGKLLSRLEQSGVLHALQVLTENAIGKAKQLLKASSEPVPVSAYDAFASLARLGSIDQADLEEWNGSITSLFQPKKWGYKAPCVGCGEARTASVEKLRE